ARMTTTTSSSIKVNARRSGNIAEPSMEQGQTWRSLCTNGNMPCPAGFDVSKCLWENLPLRNNLRRDFMIVHVKESHDRLVGRLFTSLALCFIPGPVCKRRAARSLADDARAFLAYRRTKGPYRRLFEDNASSLCGRCLVRRLHQPMPGV